MKIQLTLAGAMIFGAISAYAGFLESGRVGETLTRNEGLPLTQEVVENQSRNYAISRQ